MRGSFVLLGVTGSIAAYKAVELLRRLLEAGVEVQVAMTPAATRFVPPLTFRELAGRPVLTDLFAESAAGLSHVALARQADLLLIAPATADLIGRLAAGLADDPVSVLFLATRAPVILAPAMEENMYLHPSVQRNLEYLQTLGVRVVGPEEGPLASGSTGLGRLAAPERILAAVAEVLAGRAIPPGAAPATAGLPAAGPGAAMCGAAPPAAAAPGPAGPPPWNGHRVLVTAGGTQEPLDPVRFLANRSSGRMGYALAEAARAAGAEVTLIAGFSSLSLPPPPGVRVIPVRTALEMRAAVLQEAFSHHILFMAAAVADFRPRQASPGKIRKEEEGEVIHLELVRNPDILAEVGKEKVARGAGPVLVGFAAETGDLEAKARAKLARKPGVDLLVANDVSRPGSGFEVATNQVVLITPAGRVERWPLLTKAEVAARLLAWTWQNLRGGATQAGSPPG